MSENLNRAFMYGESVFTTMRMLNGVLQDWDLHFERLSQGSEFVYGPFTDDEHWKDAFRNRVESRLLGIEGDKVIRLTIYREQARGLVRSGLISVTDLKIHLSVSPFEQARFQNKKLKLRTCPVSKRPYWWPSFLKSGNYLETILAQKMYMKPGDDDVLFLSPEDTILESSVANIFVVRHNKLFTPPAGPNVLQGVMRKKLMNCALEFFDDVSETETTMAQLLKADAVIGTNSLRGLFLVDRIDDYEISYTDDFLQKFYKLQEKVLS